MNSDARRGKKKENGRIHIVHVVTSLEPGGLENGVVNLANSLDATRFRTSIVCLERIGEFRARLNADVPVICLEKPPGFHWRTGIQLGEILERISAQVIHTHNLGPLIYGALARRIGRGSGVIVHGEHAELRTDEKTFKRRWLRRIGYRFCAAVHTVSSGLRDQLIHFGLTPEKVLVILNGVDCARFEPVAVKVSRALRESHGIPLNSFVIGMVGRFGAFKRHDRLIRAFEELAGQFPGAYLLLVGDHGPEKEKALQQMTDSRFRERISWAGFQDDPVPWYRMMNLLVIPSDNEGLSNVMLEAMACGLPCLANTACGAAEVIDDRSNGYLRPMADEKELAHELTEIIGRNAASVELGNAARQTALERFSLDVMVRGYERFYEEVLKIS